MSTPCPCRLGTSCRRGRGQLGLCIGRGRASNVGNTDDSNIDALGNEIRQIGDPILPTNASFNGASLLYCRRSHAKATISSQRDFVLHPGRSWALEFLIANTLQPAISAQCHTMYIMSHCIASRFVQRTRNFLVAWRGATVAAHHNATWTFAISFSSLMGISTSDS